VYIFQTPCAVVRSAHIELVDKGSLGSSLMFTKRRQNAERTSCSTDLAIRRIDECQTVCPLLICFFRFRAAAVSVLAANRLQMLIQHSNTFMFSCDDSALSSTRIIAVAGKGNKRTPPKAKSALLVFYGSRLLVSIGRLR